MDAQRLAEIKALYGFDKPAHERFVQMLGQSARFDLGAAFFRTKMSGSSSKKSYPFWPAWGCGPFLSATWWRCPWGIAKAVRAGSRFDLLTTLVILVGYAIPGFVLGLALLVIFGGQCNGSAARAHLQPLGRFIAHGQGGGLPVAHHLARAGHGGGQFAVTAMLTKNAFLEEIRKQYVLTARAKGLSERQVLYRHVFRNALLPIVTGFPAAFIGAFFTGSLLN